MLESLKSLWARWKVQVSFVGGALVVATAFGTCSYDPQEVSEEPAAEAESTSEETSVEVSNTTTTEGTTTEAETINTISEDVTNTTGE
jgi:hypothetical protein